jgi:hypothetical protein
LSDNDESLRKEAKNKFCRETHTRMRTHDTRGRGRGGGPFTFQCKMKLQASATNASDRKFTGEKSRRLYIRKELLVWGHGHPDITV